MHHPDDSPSAPRFRTFGNAGNSLAAGSAAAGRCARAVAEHRQADDRLRHMTQLTMTPAPGRATAIAAGIRTLFRLS